MINNSIKYMPLHDVISYEQPTKYIVQSQAYRDDYQLPVLTAGKSFILGYTNETKGVCMASKENPVIIFDDFTTSLHWVDFSFKIKSSAMKILHPVDNTVNFKYLYYQLKNLNYTVSPGTHSRHWISKYSKQTIAIIPIDEQNEIVRILDNFRELESELKLELIDRKIQYNFYRKYLLDLVDDNDSITKYLSEISIYENGKGHEKFIETNGQYTLINSKFISSEGEVYKKTAQQFSPIYNNEIALVLSDLPNGKALAKCFFVQDDNKYSVNQRICRISVTSEEVIPKYLFYYLDRNSQLLQYNNGSDQTNLRKESVLEVLVKIPSIKKQRQIIETLDVFDSLVKSTFLGLPAEIEARRKQYEYYRNKLLTF